MPAGENFFTSIASSFPRISITPLSVGRSGARDLRASIVVLAISQGPALKEKHFLTDTGFLKWCAQRPQSTQRYTTSESGTSTEITFEFLATGPHYIRWDRSTIISITLLTPLTEETTRAQPYFSTLAAGCKMVVVAPEESGEGNSSDRISMSSSN